MLNGNLRFWGEIDWIFKHLPSAKWSVVGNLSTEERCLGTLQFMHSKNLIERKLFFEIHDPVSEKTKLIEEKIDLNKKEYFKLVGDTEDIEIHELMELVDKYIQSIDSFIESAGENILLDISTFPKRFFFPIVKRIISCERFKNILISYSTPLSYSLGELSDNADPWDTIPLFGPTEVDSEKPEIAIVGVGFMPLGLPSLLQDDYKSTTVKLIFPFPPGSPNFQRTWQFVREIESKCSIDAEAIIRINSNNTSEAYDIIKTESEDGTKKLIFAPYGPKPISLAMCLFACKYNTEVYYTQPHYYNPDYSMGIDKTYTYCIRLNGVDLYN